MYFERLHIYNCTAYHAGELCNFLGGEVVSQIT